MTRQEIFTLIEQVLNAKADLALAEAKFSRLNNKLIDEMHELFPLLPPHEVAK